MRQSHYVRYDNQFHRPRRRKPDNALRFMVGLTAVLAVTVVVLLFVSLLRISRKTPRLRYPLQLRPSRQAIPIRRAESLATPTPTEAGRLPYQNRFFSALAKMNVSIGQPVSAFLRQSAASARMSISATPRHRNSADPKILLRIPSIIRPFGILTFRGNNFRNCASWGTVTAGATSLEQVWEYRNIGSMPSSAWSFSWTGTGWTGQPLAVQWDWDVQQKMNIYPDKRIKQGLTEIVQAAMDGKVYFFDLDDGMPTRDPIKVGATIKGTPAIDPRGYPILYVGQGDNNGSDGKFGFRIFSLIDGTLLHFQTGKDSRAHRTNWGACDSSPIVNAESDTLIYPSENGIIYTLKLNVLR